MSSDQEKENDKQKTTKVSFGGTSTFNYQQTELEPTEGAAGGDEGKNADMDFLKDFLKKSLGFGPEPEKFLETVDLEGIAKYVQSDKCKNIITLAGAGISTSAGIPDFRSPGTGLYDNLQKYDLPSPQSVFDIGYFLKNPEPFFMLAKELWPGLLKPTPCHYFIKMLSNRGLLLRHYTQNIDTLETQAGVDPDKLVEAHGTFRTSHCVFCDKEYNQDWMEEKVLAGTVPRCTEDDCDGVVKPDIVFFGESLPQRFAECMRKDFGECDLLIILGTSLTVQPFASLTNRVKDSTPRLYINMEKKGGGKAHPISVLFFGGGFAFDEEDNYRDVFWQGACDDGCYAFADLLGWGEELREMVKTEHAKIDLKVTMNKKTGDVPTTETKTAPTKSEAENVTAAAATRQDTKTAPTKSVAATNSQETNTTPTKSEIKKETAAVPIKQETKTTPASKTQPKKSPVAKQESKTPSKKNGRQ